ncbi:ATP-dependent DNA helicase [Wenjunlia tyrosinilytica]|uniref:ATP-dependent helicase DinG n=1 Tax=Wenjunlia tyrosinilytica TaxID=1544741 RepID=A0A917ZTV2_9ACTN|nr:ATP-dependent DNA helicase [Wenjunlia tyrosinilytica]GGO91459.1 ATP-dependent helicase [Wenjunlia tyrosinilytica]
MTRPPLPDLLHAAVTAVGGVERPGQVTMAQAVADAVDHGEHLIVQAGTGTGKSLAYLVPALAHGERVVVATATLALQRQLVERDLPRTVEALHPLLRRRPEFAMLKGRSNYLCLHRVHEGVPDEEEAGLFDPMEAMGGPSSKLGKDLLRLRDWADESETGDRDDLTPGVSDKAWAQVSVTSRECVGATKCAYGAECFAEAARERAKLADVVVTNHALLAIDAIEGAPVLPSHEVLIVDEAHELVSRVTGVATGELTPFAVNRTVKRAARLVNEKAADALQSASEGFERIMELALPGRLEEIPEDLGYVLAALRDACRLCITSLGEVRDKSVTDEDVVRKQALASIESVHGTAERILEESEYDVVWYERHDRYGASLRVAPLNVSGLLREKLFEDRSVVLTSATLKLGGDFTGVAASVGLSAEHRLPDEPVRAAASGAGAVEAEVEEEAESADGEGAEGDAGEDGGGEDAGGGDDGGGEPQWRGIDVGSPFDYPRQGILYVARHLSQPGRDGSRKDMLDELAELMEAAGGRTLGLFSSMRAAQAAAEEMRGRLELPVLLQGEDTLGELIRAFASDKETCLFGTLSLWQGVDVPGSACQLVVMDRIPFPRPDDPLMSARAKDVEQRGGNGFMAVSATHAALLIAQGAGRLVRAADDRGVVAVLDPRLANARYGSFLRASMPDFWYTVDRNQVRRSLAAINASAPEPRPVASRTLTAPAP